MTLHLRPLHPVLGAEASGIDLTLNASGLTLNTQTLVSVLAGGVGWRGRRLPTRVTHVADLASAVALVARAIGA